MRKRPELSNHCLKRRKSCAKVVVFWCLLCLSTVLGGFFYFFSNQHLLQKFFNWQKQLVILWLRRPDVLQQLVSCICAVDNEWMYWTGLFPGAQSVWGPLVLCGPAPEDCPGQGGGERLSALWLQPRRRLLQVKYIPALQSQTWNMHYIMIS